MSIEIEAKVLGALFSIGDPKNINVQKSLLELDERCFCDYRAIGLFKIIVKFFNANQLFDYFHVESCIDSEIASFFNTLVSNYWTTNTLSIDVQLLLDSKKYRELDYELNILTRKFKNELILSEGSRGLIEDCIRLSNIAAVNQRNIYTSEELSIKFLSGERMDSEVIPTGIDVLDKKNGGGFKTKSLITIAGRPSTGKTGFGVHLAHNLALNHINKHVLFFSLEMTADEIYLKQLASAFGKQISIDNEDEAISAVKKASAVNFTIDETSQASIEYIETTSRITSVSSPVSVIVVDYLGSVTSKSKFESNALRQSDITQRLAALAKELNCIVIALSQVNRDYAGRSDKCPITSDAADSSGSERNSAYWLGIHRPALDDEHDQTLKNQFIVKCRKNRWVDELWTIYFAFNQATFGEVNQYLFNKDTSIKKRSDFYKKKDILLTGDFE
jgi:replicative DNA helicase